MMEMSIEQALPRVRFQHVLGLGSASGEEFIPILKRIDRITNLDPNDSSACCVCQRMQLRIWKL